MVVASSDALRTWNRFNGRKFRNKNWSYLRVNAGVGVDLHYLLYSKFYYRVGVFLLEFRFGNREMMPRE